MTMDEFDSILAKATPRFFYTYRNGLSSGLNYFTRLTPEMLERIFAITPRGERYVSNTFHNTSINVLQAVQDMPGTLLHGYRRKWEWELSVEGVFVPSEYAPIFLDRISEQRANASFGKDNYYHPDEWDEGHLFHYLDESHNLIETDHVEDVAQYRAYWSTGLPYSSTHPKDMTDNHKFYWEFWKLRGGKRIPSVTEEAVKYYRAWYD